MNADRYTKAVLTLIALCLVVIAFRSFLIVSPAAAARKIEYRVVNLGGSRDAWPGTLTPLGNEGWEIAALDSPVAIMRR